MISTLFQTSVSTFTTLLDPAARNVVVSALAATVDPFSALLVIYVIVTGFMCSFGELKASVGVSRILRAGFVAMLMSVTYFDTYVSDLFLTTLPNWISSVVSSKTATSVPQQCDLIRSAMLHMAAAIYQNSDPVMNMDVRLETAICTFLGTCLLAVLVLMATVVHAFMYLTIILAPFVIAAYLFDATKPFVEGWVGKAVGLTLLQLLISIVAQIVVTADSKMMLAIANATANGMQEQVANLVSIVVFFFMMAIIILGLPSIAYSVGRGIAINTAAGAVLAAPGKMLRTFNDSNFNISSRR